MEEVKFDENLEREKFEQAIFLQYYLSGIKKTNDRLLNAASIHFVPSKQLTKAEFLSKKEDGHYTKDSINGAWWGWKSRAMLG